MATSDVRTVASSNPFVSGGRSDEKAAAKQRRRSYDESVSRGSDPFHGPGSVGPYEDDRTVAVGRSRSPSGESVASKPLGRSPTEQAAAAQRAKYLGSFAPNPSAIRLLRFFLYTLTSLSSLITAGFAISVVQYYNAHEPSIKPSWGSLIALIVFGIITPGGLFGTFLITPRLFRYGTFGGILNQVRIELLLLFGYCVIWVSGALAMAYDLRGYENCIWNGYYHYPKPSNFNHVCDLINTTVIMGYMTFGLMTITWFVTTALAAYILLHLDQEVLTELTNDMGGRAYRARTYALAVQEQQHRRAASAQRNMMSEKSGPFQHRRAVSVGATGTDARTVLPEALPTHEADTRAASRSLPSEFFGRDGRSDYRGRDGRSDIEGGPMTAVTAREQALWDRDMRDA